MMSDLTRSQQTICDYFTELTSLDESEAKASARWIDSRLRFDVAADLRRAVADLQANTDTDDPDMADYFQAIEDVAVRIERGASSE